MAIILDLDNTGLIPQTRASGLWPITAFNTGKFGFVWSPVLPSTDSAWRPTGSTYGFWCIFGTQLEPNGSGIWLEYIVATQVHSIVFVRTSDGNVITGARVPITWGANQQIRVVGDMQSGAVNAASIMVSGALTGNTTVFFTREPILAAGTLEYGRWNGQFTLLASTISDVDDTVAGAIIRAMGATLAPAFSANAEQTHVRGMGASLSSSWTASAQVADGTVQRSVNATIATVWTATGRQTHQRQLGVSAFTSWSISALDGLFSRGAFGSARVLFGTAAGTVSVTLNTATSNSTVFVGVGGRLADIATAMTDSRGNTWTLLYTEEYARWAGYGIRVYRCIGLNGGAGHVFSQQFGQTAGFDEATIAVYEQQGAAHVEATSMVERGIAASLLTGPVPSQAACAWVVLFSGDAPTGATAVLTPDNGLEILDQSTGVDDPNGYVPLLILAAEKPPGSHQSTIGISPSQGAIIFSATVQAQAVIGRTVGITVNPVFAATATQHHVRTFGVSLASSWSITAQATIQRAIGATASAQWVVNASQLWQRLLSASVFSEWVIAGESLPIGAVQRTISIQAASSWAATASQTHGRQLGVTSSTSWAISLNQTHVRSTAVGLVAQWAINSLASVESFATFHTLVGYRTGEYSVHRPGETTIVNGRAVRSPPSVLVMEADIQPISGRFLRSAPEGVDTDDIRLVFTDFELFVGRDSSGTNNGREPDLVMIEGEPWRVIRVAHHNVISGHYQATIQRRWHS